MNSRKLFSALYPFKGKQGQRILDFSHCAKFQKNQINRFGEKLLSDVRTYKHEFIGTHLRKVQNGIRNNYDQLCRKELDV